MDEPGIKVAYFVGTLDALTVLGPQEAEARRRLEHVIAGVHQMSRVGWVPIQWDLDVTHVVHDLGGVAAVHAMNVQALLASAGGPLLAPVFGTALKLFGVQPSSALKVVAQAWALGSRGLGTIVVRSVDDEGALIESIDLPDAVHGDLPWAEAQVGMIKGICELTGYEHLGSEIDTSMPRVHRLPTRWKKIPPAPSRRKPR